MDKPYGGLFITIEGGDGCGKTTLSEKLADLLQKRGYVVLRTREPGGTPLSERIRTLVLDPTEKISIGSKAELLLFLAARAQHVEEEIAPALQAGKVVICERFHDSTVAYQGYARHLGAVYVEKLCHFTWTSPDCTLFLDIDPAEGLQRIEEKRARRDRMEQEWLQFHQEVRQGFIHLAAAYPQRITVIDATLPINTVVSRAMEAVEPHLVSSKR